MQTHDGRGKNHQAYLWQYSRPGGSVVFDFRMGREREGPKRFLGNFEGILQSDGYGAYDHVGGKQIVYAACWAHARRKFFDAVQLNANDQTSIRIVAQMNELFAIDAQARDERFKQNRSSTSTDGEIQTVTGPNQDDDRGSSRQSTSQECPRQGVQLYVDALEPAQPLLGISGVGIEQQLG